MGKEWVLENDILFGGAVLRAGKILDDAAYDIPSVVAAGGQIIPADPVSTFLADNLSTLRSQGRGANIDPGIPISANLKSVGSTTYLTQPEWHVHASLGSDKNDGKTTGKPLKTWAEVQRRLGTWTTLNPLGGTVVFYIESDLPPSDPLTFNNFMANGTHFEWRGKEKAPLATGVVASPVARDRTNNVAFAFTNNNAVPANFWTALLGYAVVNTTVGPRFGSKTYAAKDMGTKKVMLKQWVLGTLFETDFKGEPPLAGDTFKVVDYVHVTLGPMISAGPLAFPLLYKLHIEGVQQSPTSLGLEFWDFIDCIIDRGLRSAEPVIYEMINCCIRGGIDAASDIHDFSNLWFPNADVGFPGAATIEAGASMLSRGDSMFMGVNTEGIDADIVVKGSLDASMMSWWDGNHTLALIGGEFGSGRVNFTGDDFLLGEDSGQGIDFNQYWGNGNNNKIYAIGSAAIWFNSFSQIAAGPLLPAVEFDEGAGGNIAIFNGDEDQFGDDSHKGVGFDASGVTTGTAPNAGYGPMEDVKWSNFPLLIGAGGFSRTVRLPFGPGYEDQYGVAIHPGSGVRISWQNFTFTP